MKERFFLVAAGVAIGLLLFGLLMTETDNPCTQSKKALKKCEASLPHNQVCIITAVPQEEQP